ncbi:hypothetical protein [Caulobacter sp.]|uniref:hypothetical protein n=1 Tax=Caulobacter sp. TaxID=78 RepID=UPI003BAB540D
MKSGWFGPKAFGAGAQPTGWQGWLVTLVFALAMIATTLVTNDLRLWVQGGLLVLLLAVIRVTYRASDLP